MHSVPSEIWEKGNCRGLDTNLFYPDRDARTYAAQKEHWERICRGSDQSPPCPVLLECLFYGLVTEDRFGVWGGLSVRERNALRRHRDLSKYKSARPLAGTRYYALIENYLEQHAAEGVPSEDQEEEADEPEADSPPGSEEE